MRAGTRFLLVALFLLHALPFFTRPALIGGDEPHYALMAFSIGVDRDVDLEPNYQQVEQGSKAAGRKFAGRALDRHLVDYRGERYFAHPLGLPTLAAPLVAGLAIVSPGTAPDLALGLLGLSLTFLALLAGHRLLLDLGLPKGEAKFLVFAIYFSTPLWFYSRLFFTEAYTWSLVVLTVYLLTRGLLVPASICAAALFWVKEANALFVLALLFGVLRRFGLRQALLFALGPAAGFGLWLVKNLWIYGEAVVTFQPFRRGNAVDGAIGLLVDSQHGLLPFAPVLAIALLGALLGAHWRPAHRGPLRDLELLSLSVFLAVFLLTSVWFMWWGGSCYGPRLLVPVIPALAITLTEVWRRTSASGAARTVFILLAAVGFAIQWVAATDPFQAFWEISVGDLMTGRPLVWLSGLLIGLAISWRLVGNRSDSAATS